MDFYGTIGPACGQLETLQRMVEAGMTGIRMNLSHGPLTAHADWLAMIRAVGIRAHFLATVERPGEENVFPVNESEIWEDPFEWNISFRKNAECSWLQWKIAKTDWSPEMGIPKELYLKEEDILLLTDS